MVQMTALKGYSATSPQESIQNGLHLLQTTTSLMGEVMGSLETIHQLATQAITAQTTETVVALNQHKQLETEKIATLLTYGVSVGLSAEALRKQNALKYTTHPHQDERLDVSHVLVPFSSRYIRQITSLLNDIDFSTPQSAQHVLDVSLPQETGYLTHLQQQVSLLVQRLEASLKSLGPTPRLD